MCNRVVSNDYSSQDYWDHKYSEKDTIFEWLEDYSTLQSYITSRILRSDKILVPGCGNSAISADMYKDGYLNLYNIDFSPVCIEQMKKRFADMDKMEWRVMDITKMDYDDEMFDTVLDKGTLDALTCGEDTDKLMEKACNEYMRVLKPGGIAYIISFGQSEDRLCYFNPEGEHNWIFDGFDLLDREIAPHCYYHVYKLLKPK